MPHPSRGECEQLHSERNVTGAAVLTAVRRLPIVGAGAHYSAASRFPSASTSVIA